MEVLVLSLTAFLVAILTFFSGFGLGTILTPAFMFFFPADISVALTGVVHFFNNIFKLFLVGRHADRVVVLQFGIPAVLAAVAGAWLLLSLSDRAPLFTYSLMGKTFVVYPVRFMIAVFLIVFALVELIPYFNRLQFGREKLALGGALSGFFGGLSGNQGALRSAFLIKAGLSKEAFIATAVVVSTFVDFTRLTVYATRFRDIAWKANLLLLMSATLSAIAGAYIGNFLLKKVTVRFIQVIVSVMLILVSLALAAGWI